jgi:hypothetical protein
MYPNGVDIAIGTRRLLLSWDRRDRFIRTGPESPVMTTLWHSMAALPKSWKLIE